MICEARIGTEMSHWDVGTVRNVMSEEGIGTPQGMRTLM
jgi:hypothetical protein